MLMLVGSTLQHTSYFSDQELVSSLLQNKPLFDMDQLASPGSNFSGPANQASSPTKSSPVHNFLKRLAKKYLLAYVGHVGSIFHYSSLSS